MSRFPSAAASLAFAAALFAVALGARSGTELGRTTTTEIVLVVAGAAIVCLALLRVPSRPMYGGLATLLFAALAALTVLSIGWSIAPDLSYIEAGRTLAYLAVFAGAVAAARLWPSSAPTVARGVVLAAVAVIGYGLAARIWPGSFEETALNGRIGGPYDYWNALGGTAALATAPALWLGARRGGSRLGRVLAFPALGMCITAILLTQSRGALAAGIAACALWLLIAPVRLRSIALLAVSGIGVVPLVSWALSKDAFVRYAQDPAARETVSGDFGLIVAATLIGLAAAGWITTLVESRLRLSTQTRFRIGVAIAVAIAVVPMAGLASVATSDRGVGGTVSDRFDDLTSETTVPPLGGGRLGSVSSSRSAYWRQAWEVFEERPSIGLGAASFEIARISYRKNALTATRAHGFLLQTLSDLGIVGLCVVLALLAAWLAAASRSTGLDPRRRAARPDWTDERTALVALAFAVVAYGIQSLVDWTWFVPGLTVTALAAAGYVAGRGPLRPVGAVPPEGADAAEQQGFAESLHSPSPFPVRAPAAAVVALAALFSCWAIWQPESSDRATAHSYELLDEGRVGEALEEAQRARDRNPYSVQPLFAQAAIHSQQGRTGAALRALQTAVLEHPRDPDVLLRLATFELHTLDDPQRALRTADAAARLDPFSRFPAELRAEAALAAQTAGPR